MFACEYNIYRSHYKLIAPNGTAVGYISGNGWYYENSYVSRACDAYSVTKEYYLFYRTYLIAIFTAYYKMNEDADGTIEMYETECEDISIAASELLALDSYEMQCTFESMLVNVIKFDSGVTVDGEDTLDTIATAVNRRGLDTDSTYLADGITKDNKPLIVDIRIKTTSYMESQVKRNDLAPNVYVIRDES